MKQLSLPVRLALTVAVSIFVVEIVIMGLLPGLHLTVPWVEMLVDSGVLVLTLVPVLYAFILRPLRLEMSARVEAELRLLELNAGLESRVAERTRELEVALRAAEAAAKAKSQFLACISHELRTPLNAVIGMTQLLMGTPLSEDQSELVRMSHVGGRTLMTLVDDVLDFSKLEAGKLELDVSDVELLCMVEDCAKLAAVGAHEKGLEIAVRVEPGLPSFVRADAGRLRQVLMNLLNNAVKFTSAGEIVLGVRGAGGSPPASSIRFEIRDTGIGILPEVQPRLFAAFTQADASTTRRYGGTGLGLAISRWLVELMGGKIGLESFPGKGSTFWFEIPFERREGPAAGSLAASDRAGLQVLVVDDNGSNREILKGLLDGWGMRCRSEENGPQALAELERAARLGRVYELAIIDARMPGMGGLELARAIRANAVLARVPMIMMSSMDGAGLPRESDHAGLTAWLTKPVRQAALIDAIARVTARSLPERS